MTIAKSKVKWCLEKAEEEIKKGKKHRGLVKVKADKLKAVAHIEKAEHYLKATEYLKKGGFSDISMSTLFYANYHALSAIIKIFGYESRNQYCTVALISSLIEDKKIDLDKKLVDKFMSLDETELAERTSTDIRERMQYGTELAIKDDTYTDVLNLAKQMLFKARQIVESESKANK